MQMWFLYGNRDWSIIKKWNSDHILETIPVKKNKKQERHLKKLKNRKVFHTHILEEYLKIMKEGA